VAENKQVRIGTRGSPLARWQAEWVAARLAESGVEVVLVPIATQGDIQQRGPIGEIGTLGVFTTEIQRALLDRQVDLAVHSLKDLPTEPVEGLCLAAVPKRGPHGDVLISRAGQSFAELPPGAAIGTGSSRRRSQLWHARPDLKMLDVRGNVDTRLRKLHEGQYDALVLAEAGVTRLELRQYITEVLPQSLILPAVGQGALGLETRVDDKHTRHLLSSLDDKATHQGVLAERAMLAALRGGCLAPVGALGRLAADGQLHLDGIVLSQDGRTRLASHAQSDPLEAVELGERLAADLLDQGADELIESARR
jgi:hydroxymethylbilane synthase